MPTVNEFDIRTAYVNGGEVSSLRMGDSLVWEHPTQVDTFVSSAHAIPVPDWAVAISIAIIGGGGGGQSGNGTNGGSGRPGDAAEWAIYYRNLNRNPGDKFTINFDAGEGGAGGSNSDHSAGKQGGLSRAVLLRNTNGVITTVATYDAAGGKGGPDSGLGVGASSSRPTNVTAPRQALLGPVTLPRGAAAGKEQEGGSPGAGGGYGGGGYFGSRGRGSAGGKGLGMFYYYGAP